MSYQKKIVIRTPFRPSFPPSPEQSAIFDAVKFDDRNIHVDAKAGTGKSTTLLWMMSELRSHHKGAMMAFNSEIVREIEPKCPSNITVKTMHGFGWASLAKQFGRPELHEKKVQIMLKEKYGWLNPDGITNYVEKTKVFNRLMDTCNLVDKLRVTLTDECDPEAVQGIIDRFNIQLDMEEAVIEILPFVMQKLMNTPTIIDYTDMMWLPIRFNLALNKFPILFVDEAQDFNNLMTEYAKRMCGGRIITVGDANQAIYGFAGSNTQSIYDLIQMFNSHKMPLNTCYRCGSKIIELAQTMVPEIVAHSSTGEGEVNVFDELDTNLPEGSMILSRRNANLIGPCFKIIASGRKAMIKGRDIGSGLVKLIDKQNAIHIEDLILKMENWKEERVKKLLLNPKISSTAIDGTEDQFECIKAVAENCSTVPEVVGRIKEIFSDEKAGIVCSSIHRSKGLEADHVVIVDYPRIRLNNDKMTPEDHIQERNLNYVAVTRAKKRLDLITQ